MTNGSNGRNGRSGRSFNSQQALNQAVWQICDILRRSNCQGAMQYVPELTWLLFLRILDEQETNEAAMAAAVGERFTPSLQAPYRWQDWAAPGSAFRKALTEQGGGRLMQFVNGSLRIRHPETGEELEGLIPHLKGLEKRPGATPRQKIISEVLSSVERARVDTERNFLEVLDGVHAISHAAVEDTHIFTLSQVYEGLLLRMGEKGNDGGQFFTPREVIRAMVRVVDPRVGETVYDPGCGTGGFLAQAFEHMCAARGDALSPEELETLKHRTFYGREKDDLIYPIALANLLLHGIDEPHLWHGNTLTNQATYAGLFENAPEQFDVVLMNPPFGGKEGEDARKRFDFKTNATQVLFLQHVMKSLAPGGRCGIVVDEGVLFRTNENGFVQTKKKLGEDFNLWCIVSLPGGAFVNAGAGVKTNLLFFDRKGTTEKIWYYDLSHVKVGKKSPLTVKHFEEFFRLLPERADGDHSWTVDLAARRAEAREQSDPLREQAEERVLRAFEARERLKALKKAKAEQPEIDAAAEELFRLETEIRELRAKAEAIDDAVYDLKAVNPNVVEETDTRTPEELLDLIEEKGREVAAAMAELRRLCAAGRA